jgi:hypothetical protein
MFVIANVEPGTYRVAAERAGFVRGEYGAHGSDRTGSTVRVSGGQKVTGILIKLTPQTVITGRVLDEDGDPVAGAAVSVMRYSYARGRRQLVPAGGNTTDDQGEYRIHSLPPGKYYVTAAARVPAMWGRGARPVQADDAYAPAYYPNAPDVAIAAPLSATAGSVLRGIDIRLSKTRTVSASGKVIQPSGRPLGRGAFVSAVREGAGGSPAGRASGTVQPDNSFLIRGLRPGAWVLTGEARDGDRRLTARQTVMVTEEGVEGVVLSLAARSTVSGTIRIDGGAEVNLTGTTVYLEPRNDMTASESVSGRVEAGGAFTINNGAPDAYSVAISGMPDGCYLKAVRFGNEDALANGLDLSRGAGAPVEITLSPAAGSVDVAVLDAKQQPAAGAVVVAVPAEASRGNSLHWYHSGSTDQNGHVTLKNLAPGEYSLYAWEEVETYAWMDPEVRRPFQKRTESLSIRENARESKQVTVIPAGAGE